MTGKSTRRGFLETATTAAAIGSGVLPVFGVARAAVSANETVRLGVIGCGKRGRYLIERFKEVPDAPIVSVCDVHQTNLARAREAAGGEKVKATGDFRKLLEDQEIDAVIVATPVHWHALQTIMTCAAGKDLYLEKPLGTSIGEGRAAVEAAKRFDRIVQIGTQQKSWDIYEKAVEAIRSGRLGDISHVEVFDNENNFPGYGSPPDSNPPSELDWEMWLGPAPLHAFNPNRLDHYYWYLDYGGGWVLDWAVHHYDIVQWAMDVKAPISAMAAGGKLSLEDDDREWPDTLSGVVEYGPGPVAKRGFLMQYTTRSGGKGPGRSHGKAFYGTDGSMLLDRSGFTITGELRNGKKVVMDETVTGISEDAAVVQHARNFIECVKSRKQPFADIQGGHDSTNPGHLLNISWRLGRKIHWDAKAEEVIDDPQANALVTRAYRAPWSLQV